MIKDRPKYLLDKPGYSTLPRFKNLRIDLSTLHPLLQNDIELLHGFRPITGEAAFVIENSKKIKIDDALIKYYEHFDIHFQMVLLVFSCFHYRSENENIALHPYSISLRPAIKNGYIDERPVRSCLSLPNINNFLSIYSHFSPFHEISGFFGNPSYLYKINQENIFLDQIGWNNQFYLLAIKFDPQDILHNYPEEMSEEWIVRFNKYRTKKFYKKFENKIPRKIWGIDSPIELFVLQGLAYENLFPLFQVSLYADGNLFPSYWDIASIEPKLSNKITDFDIYFPDKKLAILCDGRRFHSKHNDNKIDKAIKEAGIRVLRFTGSEINKNLGYVIEKIIQEI